MKNFINQILPGNKAIWISYFFLVLASIIVLFSASSTLVAQQGSVSGPIMRHIFFLSFGFFVIICMQKVSTKFIRYVMGYALLIFSWVLLVLVMFVGEQKGGATRSIFGIQPSEFARLALIITTASFIAKATDKEYLRSEFWWFSAEFIITLALVVPSNLSTTILLGFTIFAMLIIGRIPWKYIFKLMAVCLLLFSIFISVSLVVVKIYPDSKQAPRWTTLFRRVETWEARIINFQSSIFKSSDDEKSDNPWYISDEPGINNRQSIYSLIAVSRGGISGVGPGKSNQKEYLPEAYSDFIFAIICEEYGLLGLIFLFGSYIALFVGVVCVVYKSKNFFYSLMCAGGFVIMSMQIIIHCFVCLKLFPLTGQPLPMISNGGSSILINSIYIGIFIYASRDWKFVTKKAKVMEVDSIEADSESSVVNIPSESVDDISVDVDITVDTDRKENTESKTDSDNEDKNDNEVTIEIM